MVQERRGTYQDVRGGADPHPPSSLSLLSGAVCVLFIAVTPTSPGPHPPAPST